MKYLLIGLALVALAYGYHRVATWMAERGWIYYGKNHKRPATAGLGILAPIYNPALEHVMEEEQRQVVEADEEESGQGKP